MTIQRSTLWRGPFLVCLVLLPILYPYLETLDLKIVLRILLIVTGIALFTYDCGQMASKSLQTFLHRQLDHLVLDDVLKTIFGEYMTTIVTSMIGNTAMYTLLPTTPSQRTQIVQATLGITQKEARDLLLEPGGCKHLLPERAQQWLGQKDGTTQEKEFLDDNTTSSLSSQEFAERPASPQVTHQKLPEEPQVSFSQLMATLLCHDTSLTTILKQTLEQIPSPALQGTASIAFASLLFQMRYSRRARDLALTAAHGSLSVALGAILLGTTSTLLTKYSLEDGKGLQKIIALTKSGVRGTQQLISALLKKASSTKWQGLIAVLVLYLVGKRRDQVRVVRQDSRGSFVSTST